MNQSDQEHFLTSFSAAVASLGVTLRDEQSALLWRHFCAVLEANRVMNLTRITDPAEAAVKHYADSLALLSRAEPAGEASSFQVLDVGTGAGFPAVPLAVMRPAWRITAIDSTGKKVRFVQESAASLGLKNLEAIHARAEHWRPDHGFRYVLVRAVAPLARCLEKTSHLLTAGGRLIAWKGPELSAEELSEARQAAGALALRLLEPFAYELPLGNDTLRRTLQVFARIA